MASRLSPHVKAVSRPGRPLIPQDAFPDDVILPMLSGAQARGMADVFALLGLPAVFLGPDARVLFANMQARSLVGLGIELRADHLVATDAADNEGLSGFVAAALSAGVHAPAMSLPHALTPVDRSRRLTLHAISLPNPVSGPQLLRVVLLLDTEDDPAVTAFLHRMAATPSSDAQSRLAV